MMDLTALTAHRGSFEILKPIWISSELSVTTSLMLIPKSSSLFSTLILRRQELGSNGPIYPRLTCRDSHMLTATSGWQLLRGSMNPPQELTGMIDVILAEDGINFSYVQWQRCSRVQYLKNWTFRWPLPIPEIKDFMSTASPER